MGIADTAVKFDQFVATDSAEVDRATLREVFEDCGGGLYRFILIRLGGNRSAADDLLQQTCFEAVRHRFCPQEREGCEAWLRGIARNLIKRHWRMAKREMGTVSIEDAQFARQLAEDMESRPLPVDSMIRSETFEQLLLAITALPAVDQDVIFAHYFKKRSQADIARAAGVTEKSVECRLFRARGRLRQALRHMERSGE